MRNFIILLLLFYLFTSCSKDCNPISSENSHMFIFVERGISTTGEIIEMDTTKFIIIRTVEPGIFFNFDQDTRILEYTTGVQGKVPINNDLLVWIATSHFFSPPDRTGLSVQMNPIYYKSLTYIDSNLVFQGVRDDGTIEFGDKRVGVGFHLPIDSLKNQTFYRYKKVPLDGGDPFAAPDSALIKLIDKVWIYNHGYLSEKQIHWNDFSTGD